MLYKKYQNIITLHTVQGNGIEGYSGVVPSKYFTALEIENSSDWELIS